MAKWNNLPVEILEAVLKGSSKTDVLQCQLTCRSWEKSCIKIAYKQVNLFSPSRIDAFVRTIRTSTKMHGVYVTDLFLGNHFGTTMKDWDPLNQFNMLVKFCPNVEVILLMPPCIAFYQQVMRERFDGNWKKLRAINSPNKPEELEYYNAIIMTMQEKVTFITIGDQTVYGPDKSQPELYNKMLSNLENFNNLKQLNIVYHTNKGITQYDSIIDACSTLNEINIVLYPLTESVDLGEDDYQEIQPNTNITKLNIKQVIHSERTIGYIMEKFTKAEILHINDKYENVPLLDLVVQAPTYSGDFLDRFCTYLKARKFIRADNLFAQNMDEVVHYLTTHLCDFELRIPLTIHDFSDGLAFTSISLNILNQFRFISLNCVTGDTSLPFLNVLDQGGRDLRKLLITNEGVSYPDRVRLQRDFNELVTGAYLDRLFEACVNLKHLTLEKMVLIYCREQAAINRSIRHLLLKDCSIYGPIFYQLSVRLPELRILTVENWKNTNPDGRKKADRRLNFFFDMPYTAFDYLCLKCDDSPEKEVHPLFYVKLSTIEGEFYFKGSSYTLDFISAAVFRTQVSSTKTLTIQIRCKCLRRLQLSGWGMNHFYRIP
ncbi:hypothetical protein A0J61_03130 [Choanephora cucurbitarum]|uniref:F-box domain-containing protein n=1 Tax=Choanephora cucurbitarum TaxID=101091 RepID=A0A1C7NIK5_9FUNG|nr:hypothetical protein A0J61_03130 [Choanephora cucurbitarum]